MLTKRRRGFTLVEMLTVMVVIALLAAIIIPNFRHSTDSANYAACQQNITNIATALQAYANDNAQAFPTTTSALIPTYLPTMPTCPAAQADTYSSSYESSLQSTGTGMFTIYCNGFNHSNIVSAPNEPYYIFGQGLGP